jgi:hypothetical protein
MDDRRIEDALRSGPPDEPGHRQGALARGLAARDTDAARDEVSFRVRLRPQSSAVPLILVGVVVAVALTLALIIGLGSAPKPTPGPSPSSSTPVASPTIQGAPLELVDRWAGPTRTIASLKTPATRAFLDIRGAALRFDAGPGQPGDLLSSSVTQAAPDVLRVVASSRSGGCEAFDEGMYRWSLSAGRTNLRIELMRDACAARAAALPGTWTHTACRDAAQDCLGALEAGAYRSTEFDPFGTGQAGQLGYSVPAGWANTIDFPTNYFLRPAPEYEADPGFDGNDTIGGIYIWAGTLAADQPADCSGVAAPGVAASADAIATHIATLPGIRAVVGDTLELDGRVARVLDLTLDPTYTGTCPFSNGEPFRSLITFADLGSDRGVWGLGRSGRQHVLILDATSGRVVSVWVEGEISRFESLLRDATPIVKSLSFTESSTIP